MERRGVPAVLLATEPFVPLALQQSESYGLRGARLAVIGHPLGAISPAEVEARADAVIDDVLRLLVG
ncbi:MAG: hypothetical protein P8R42_30255 [Candidatus Binatia bacterium]|nr:hypothetical protein [Candidatus Binatia bacterium]